MRTPTAGGYDTSLFVRWRSSLRVDVLCCTCPAHSRVLVNLPVLTRVCAGPADAEGQDIGRLRRKAGTADGPAGGIVRAGTSSGFSPLPATETVRGLGRAPCGRVVPPAGILILHAAGWCRCCVAACPYLFSLLVAVLQRRLGFLPLALSLISYYRLRGMPALGDFMARWRRNAGVTTAARLTRVFARALQLT